MPPAVLILPLKPPPSIFCIAFDILGRPRRRIVCFTFYHDFSITNFSKKIFALMLSAKL